MMYRIERFHPIPKITEGETTEFGKGECTHVSQDLETALNRWEEGAEDPGMYCLWQYDANGYFMLRCGTIGRIDQMRTRQEIETALDARKLKIRMPNGNLWDCRRNGKTKTWKRSPERWEIPIKYGFKRYGTLDQDSANSEVLVIID